jgi:glycosyltransferase involved in cell wall biosynthesis
MDNRKSKKIIIVGTSLGPPFNEAWSKEVRRRADYLNAFVITRGKCDGFILHRCNYLIFNSSFGFLSQIFLVASAFVFSLSAECIHIEAPPNSFWFYVLPLKKAIHTVRNRNWIDSLPFVYRYFWLKKLRKVIVYTEEERHILSKYVGNPSKIIKVSPGIDINKYKCKRMKSKKDKPFTFMFASAPRHGDSFKEEFKNKGIFSLLDAFLIFSKKYDSRLILLWRGRFINELRNEIVSRGIENKVLVINNVVDVVDFFEQSHVTVLPVENANLTPNFPSSLMESLSCGRPIICSNVLAMAKFIQTHSPKVGVVYNHKDKSIGLLRAMIFVYRNYSKLKKGCRIFAEKNFDDRKLFKVYV